MKDINGEEIHRGSVISITGVFAGVAVNEAGQPISPMNYKKTRFTGTESLKVTGTRDGETCIFIHEGYSYEADPLNNPKITILVH